MNFSKMVPRVKCLLRLFCAESGYFSSISGSLSGESNFLPFYAVFSMPVAVADSRVKGFFLRRVLVRGAPGQVGYVSHGLRVREDFFSSNSFETLSNGSEFVSMRSLADLERAMPNCPIWWKTIYFHLHSVSKQIADYEMCSFF